MQMIILVYLRYVICKYILNKELFEFSANVTVQIGDGFY